VLLTCRASRCDFPTNASLACSLKQGGLNLISLSTIRRAAARVKRDQATVITKGRQQGGNGLVNLFGLHKKS
jgi:hypothetical protein